MPIHSCQFPLPAGAGAHPCPQPAYAPADTLLRVHSVETFGTHDGPGIRLVIFVQGCQFRCLYCANPDTLSPEGGETWAVDDLVQRALQEKGYFGTKGGVTVSGGEPLLQRKVLRTFFERLRDHGIHTALDSNGRVLDADTRALLAETDLLLLDVKHMDDEWHHRLTGLSNRSTLEVAAYREASGRPFWLRHVLVPGWTDQPEQLHRLGAHFAGFRHLERLEILPYHRLGVHKWEALGMKYALQDVVPPTSEQLAAAAAILSGYLPVVRVNG
jgi:pyruvate formate lyase activating enzyme